MEKLAENDGKILARFRAAARARKNSRQIRQRSGLTGTFLAIAG